MSIDYFLENIGTFYITYTACHDGKKKFMIGNFEVDRNATDAEILDKADADINKFYQDCLPDGTIRPRVVNFQKGHLIFTYE
jgi:hypothetical protein